MSAPAPNASTSPTTHSGQSRTSARPAPMTSDDAARAPQPTAAPMRALAAPPVEPLAERPDPGVHLRARAADERRVGGLDRLVRALAQRDRREPHRALVRAQLPLPARAEGTQLLVAVGGGEVRDVRQRR